VFRTKTTICYKNDHFSVEALCWWETWGPATLGLLLLLFLKTLGRYVSDGVKN